MSILLSTPGDGILQTHISWEEIEADAQRALKTKATFGLKKFAKNLSLGKGFTSRLALIYPDWQNGNDSLPKAIIAKIPSVMNVIEFSESRKAQGLEGHWIGTEAMIAIFRTVCTKVHNAECLAYEIIQKYANGKITTPFIMSMTKFDDNENTHKGKLIMEYLKADEVAVHDNLCFEELKEAIRSIAVLQAIGTRGSMKKQNSKSQRTFMGKTLRSFILKRFDGGSIPRELLDKFTTIFHTVLSYDGFDRIDRLSDILGMNRVLSHGDLTPLNILWKKKENRQHQLVAIIDWQCIHFGCPAVDICRLVVASMSGSERREQFPAILETFYGYLVEEMQGSQPPYTFEQLKEVSAQFMPFACVYFSNSISMGVDSEKIGQQPDGKEILKRAREKLSSLIEDAIEYYEKIPSERCL